MDAAKKYSTCPSGRSGGILGWFSKGDMVKPFEEAAFNLPNGQVSEPVKTQFGWHLIYVISKK
jgi:parvulin-like peptidyl-prolyl isomerase